MKKRLSFIFSLISIMGIGVTALSCDSNCSHTNLEITERIEPTCNGKGYTERIVCKDCGQVILKSREIEATGHNLIHHEAKEATCLTSGYKAYDECTRCEYTTYEEIPALGHDILSFEAKSATCTEDGYKAYEKCSHCDYSTYEKIEATGHTLKHYSLREATCESVGWKAYDVCTKCGYSTYEEIPKLEHSWNQGTITKKATCTESGVKTYICTECYETKQEVIPAGSHTITKVNAREATCESVGWEAYEYCSNCNYTTYKEIPKLSHQYTSLVAKSPATCEKDGMEAHYRCEECNKYFVKSAKIYIEVEEEDLIIPKLGHDLVHHNAKEPSCDEDGCYAYDTCTRCNYSTYKAISKTGHNYGEEIDENPATCLEDGTKAHYECSKCHELFVRILNNYVPVTSEYLNIEALNHDIVHHNAKDPSCQENGWEAYDTCSRCDYSTYVELPKSGHNPSDEWTTDENVHYHICMTDGCEEHLNIGVHNSNAISKSAVAATYTTTGLTEEKSCSVCGRVIIEQTEVHCIEYTVNFVTYSTAIESITVYKGQENVAMPTSSKAGYIFVGWYFADVDKLITGLSVDEWDYNYSGSSATLYAVYKSSESVSNGFSVGFDTTKGTIKVGNLGEENKVYFIKKVESGKYLLSSEYGATAQTIDANPDIINTYLGKTALIFSIDRYENTVDQLTSRFYLVNGSTIIRGPVTPKDLTNDPYEGMNFVFFGDSVTAGARTNASTKSLANVSASNYVANPIEINQASKNSYSLGGAWAYQFAINHSQANIYNYAISASTVANNSKGVYTETQQYNQFKAAYPSVDVDVFAISISYNDLTTLRNRQSDYNYNTKHGPNNEVDIIYAEEYAYLSYSTPITSSPLATVPDDNGFTILDTTLGALINLIQTIHNDYPTAEVVLVLSPVRSDFTLTNYAAAVQAVNSDVNKIANAFGLKVVDLYSGSGFSISTYQNEDQRAIYWEDTIHPSMQASIDYLYDCFEDGIE